jgi:RimJ/RimL family protein N-acetyltransferase
VTSVDSPPPDGTREDDLCAIPGGRAAKLADVTAFSTPPTIVAGALAAGPQPVLSAPGDLLLRPWEAADAGVFLEAYSDPEIRRWHTRRPSSAGQVDEWFEQYRRDWAQERGGHWAVTRAGGVVLGRIALRGFDFADGVAVCAYWVLPAARGAGVASRALTAVSDWALGPAGFHRLELDHSTGNQASCRVATGSGFRLEGTKRGAAVHADGRHDMHLHARVRGD